MFQILHEHQENPENDSSASTAGLQRKHLNALSQCELISLSNIIVNTNKCTKHL